MVFFDVVDQADGGAVLMKRAVELAGLANENSRIVEQTPTRNDRRTCARAAAELRASCADDHARVKPAAHADPRGHRRRGALSVRARDRNRGHAALRNSERLGVSDPLDSLGLRSENLRMAGLDRRRRNHQVGLLRQRLHRRANAHIDSRRIEALNHVTSRLIGAGHMGSAKAKHHGQAAHATSANADKMQVSTVESHGVGEYRMGVLLAQ